MQRGAVILVKNSELILIERVRAGKTYYLFPGGGVEPGETVEQAAVREAREELGLEVVLGPLAAVVEHEGRQQHYYLAFAVGGEFGNGDGPEYSADANPQDGTYKPVRLPLKELSRHDVRPKALAAAVAAGILISGKPLSIQD